MSEVYLQALGVAGPGLENWPATAAVLRGEQPYQAAEMERYKPQRLPPNERRRATQLVRTAFRVCEELADASNADLTRCAAVFASSGGDYTIMDQICRVLRGGERQVSPTQFHNSVHNSAAGYWSIATGSRAASTSISARDDSFVAGLLEAASFCTLEQQPTLLAAYDIRPPEPLLSKRPVGADFGVALLLTPSPEDGCLAKLTVDIATGIDARATPPSRCADPALEQLRTANPAARCLPLLELLARQASGALHFAAPNRQGLQVTVEGIPCS